MGNLIPAIAMSLQQRGSRRSDPGRESSGVGTLPVCTEDNAVGRVNRYNDAPIVPSSVQTDVYYFASLQMCLLFKYGGFARIEELGSGRVCDIHRVNITWIARPAQSMIHPCSGFT
jgi:hypothetical protein